MKQYTITKAAEHVKELDCLLVEFTTGFLLLSISGTGPGLAILTSPATLPPQSGRNWLQTPFRSDPMALCCRLLSPTVAITHVQNTLQELKSRNKINVYFRDL